LSSVLSSNVTSSLSTSLATHSSSQSSSTSSSSSSSPANGNETYCVNEYENSTTNNFLFGNESNMNRKANPKHVPFLGPQTNNNVDTHTGNNSFFHYSNNNNNNNHSNNSQRNALSVSQPPPSLTQRPTTHLQVGPQPRNLALSLSSPSLFSSSVSGVNQPSGVHRNLLNSFESCNTVTTDSASVFSSTSTQHRMYPQASFGSGSSFQIQQRALEQPRNNNLFSSPLREVQPVSTASVSALSVSSLSAHCAATTKQIFSAVKGSGDANPFQTQLQQNPQHLGTETSIYWHNYPS